MARLNVVTHDSDGDALPLVIAHGLFGSARNWGVIARRLADRGPVIAPDMRNHGDSFRDPRHDYPALADDLAAIIPDRADILGHSMGGKAAMALALLHPGKVRRLIVADIAPVAYGHSQMPYLEAMRDADLDGVTRRSEAAERLDVDNAGIRSFLSQSYDASGRSWRLNLDALADQMDLIMGWPDDLDATFDGPVLFLSGADSDYVLTEHRDRIQSHFPRSRFVRIQGASHWLHADKPREVEASVRAFLDAP